MNKEDIEDKLNSTIRKRDKLIIELNNVQKEIEELAESYKELDDNYVKVNCLTCGGSGIIEDKDTGRKVICKNPMIPELGCNGKGYLWLSKYDKKEANTKVK